jgi:excisionase family DNA binding protein
MALVVEAEWLRLGAAAKRLGMSYETLRRLTKEQRLTVRQTPGGQAMVRADEIDAYARKYTIPALQGLGT